MTAGEKYYWPGNVAKAKVISKVLHQLADREEMVIFDYGCGTAGDWPDVLADFPNIRWYGYEPHGSSYLVARDRLSRCEHARVFTGNALDAADFRADVIVSFSVFEHVYDRRQYLATAHRLMAEHGVFYLNYDDGHFRQYLELGRASTWGSAVREHLHNLSAPWLAKLGSITRFQQRVIREDLDTLLVGLGFKVEYSEYNNLAALKRLFKTIPLELQQEYVRFWLQTEEELNSAFQVEGKAILGDTANLWREMTSRTLVLTHSAASTPQVK